MATFTDFVSGSIRNFGPYRGLDTEQFVIQNQVDFSLINVAASDTVQALPVQADDIIHKVFTIVDTAEGSAATADIGDGTDPNGFDDAVDFNGAVDSMVATLEATDAYGAGKLYTNSDTIDIFPDHAFDTAKVTVVAHGSRRITT